MHVSIRTTHSALQDPNISSKCRLLWPNLSRYPEREVECRVQCSKRPAEFAELTWGAEQVSSQRCPHEQLLLMKNRSASPLNGQAAEIWDSDPNEFKRLVLARHEDLTDE